MSSQVSDVAHEIPGMAILSPDIGSVRVTSTVDGESIEA